MDLLQLHLRDLLETIHYLHAQSQQAHIIQQPQQQQQTQPISNSQTSLVAAPPTNLDAANTTNAVVNSGNSQAARPPSPASQPATTPQPQLPPSSSLPNSSHAALLTAAASSQSNCINHLILKLEELLLVLIQVCTNFVLDFQTKRHQNNFFNSKKKHMIKST